MRQFSDIHDFKPLQKKATLSIGNFDGLHLGHEAILKRMHEKPGEKIILTFSNHPSTILGEKKVENLMTLDHKLRLFESNGVDTVLLLPFTKEFSLKSPEEFLSELKQKIPLQTLILGLDAKMGHNRAGDENVLRNLSKKLKFEIEYIPPFRMFGQPVSSSSIRRSINAGLLREASEMLGRRYSIFGMVQKGRELGKQIGFPTVNIAVEDLCLPPLGVWEVELLFKNKIYRGIANLGMAPTIRDEKAPLLEVHLFDFNQLIYNESVEVIFKSYIRPEKKFESLSELKTQISKDIDVLKNNL